MNLIQRTYIEALKITPWQARQEISEPGEDKPTTHYGPDWQQLKEMISNCKKCALHESRINTVFGSGNPSADLVIVGEAPGANEDRQGMPFVGRAGQLLTKMLTAIGYQREQVFICNVLKCRPPNNRDPKAVEVKTCTPYLEQQLAHIKPKCLLAVGRVAAHYLIGIEKPLNRLRTQKWQFGRENIPLFITYHPAYLLRNPRDKSKAFLDLLKVQNFLKNCDDINVINNS